MAEELAATLGKSDVVVFSYGGCPYCRKVTQAYKAANIPFIEVDYDELDGERALMYCMVHVSIDVQDGYIYTLFDSSDLIVFFSYFSYVFFVSLSLSLSSSFSLSIRWRGCSRQYPRAAQTAQRAGGVRQGKIHRGMQRRTRAVDGRSASAQQRKARGNARLKKHFSTCMFLLWVG